MLDRYRSQFIFNGKSSHEFGLRLFNEISIPHPERDYSSIEVPGMDGVLIEDNNRYKPVPMVFPCRVNVKKRNGKPCTLFEMENQIVSWLMSEPGWHDLIFMDDDKWLYRALYSGGGELKRINPWNGDIDIPFTLHPYKYDRNALEPINVSGTGSVELEIVNDTAFTALPDFTITPSKTTNIEVKVTQGSTEKTFNLTNITTSGITVWSEYEKAFYTNGQGQIVSAMDKVASYPFVSLPVGECTVTITASVASAELDVAFTPYLRTLV